MTEFLHPELNKRFRKVINSSPIFQEGELRGNFNLLCAAMDRIDTCVAYLNKHSNFPRTEEDFIIFLMFAAMLRDAVLDVLVGVLPKFERNCTFSKTPILTALYITPTNQFLQMTAFSSMFAHLPLLTPQIQATLHFCEKMRNSIHRG